MEVRRQGQKLSSRSGVPSTGKGWKTVSKAMKFWGSCGITGSSKGKVGEKGRSGHNSPAGWGQVRRADPA